MQFVVVFLLSFLILFTVNFSYAEVDSSCTIENSKYLEAEGLLDNEDVDEKLRYSQALSIYQDLYTTCGDSFPAALGGIASVYHRQNDNDTKALEYYNLALKIDPNNKFFLSDLGLLYLDEAVKSDFLANKARSNDNVSKAEEYAAASKQSLLNAKKTFFRALIHGNEHFNALNGLAEFYHFVGDYENALKFRKNALLTDYRQVDAIIGKGNDYRAMQEFGLAISSYQEALKYPTGELNALVGLGNVFMDMHSYREALTFYDKALGVETNELNAYRGKAFASHCINDDYNKLQAAYKFSELSGYDLEFPANLCSAN